jgi:uncharacterized protein YukE
MDKEVDVHPPAIRQGGDAVDNAATRVADAWAAHAERVAAMGDIFGTDPVGGLIAASYRAAHQTAERSYQSVTKSLAGFGSALHTTAAGYEQTDVDSANAITDVSPGWG